MIATDIAPERLESKKWDTMTGFKRDYARGKRNGRLLRYNPITEKVDILATGIWFANGVAVMNKDESALILSETTMARTLKYHLKGPKEGLLEVLTDRFPGYPDGADCSFELGFCYTPLPSLASPLFVKLSYLPEAINTFIRTLILMLPTTLLQVIKVVRYGGVVEIPVKDENSKSKEKINILQDPHAKEIGMVTGVATFRNQVYLGSLTNDFIGVIEVLSKRNHRSQ